MKSIQVIINRLTLAAVVLATTALCGAQTTNTIVAKFSSPPGAGQTFAVDLVNTGADTDVAGFAFKLIYDPSQVSIVGVNDNTEQPTADIQYTLGAEKVTGGNSAARILTATTIKNLEDASNLVEIEFAKKTGYAAPFSFKVTDRASEPIIDGLQDASLKNVPHTFDVSKVNK